MFLAIVGLIICPFNGKVKVLRLRATKTLRAALKMWVGGSAPRSGRFTQGKEPVPIVQEAGWVPGPVWTGEESLASTGIRSPDRKSRSESLYRLSYPGRTPFNCVFVKYIMNETAYSKILLEKLIVCQLVNTFSVIILTSVRHCSLLDQSNAFQILTPFFYKIIKILPCHLNPQILSALHFQFYYLWFIQKIVPICAIHVPLKETSTDSGAFNNFIQSSKLRISPCMTHNRLWLVKL